jgi:hypothetical protein
MTIGSIKVRVNTAPTVRVRSIQYSPGAGGGQAGDFSIANAADVIFENTENNLSVLTYDDNINKFVVQNVPRLNGGTF